MLAATIFEDFTSDPLDLFLIEETFMMTFPLLHCIGDFLDPRLPTNACHDKSYDSYLRTVCMYRAASTKTMNGRFRKEKYEKQTVINADANTYLIFVIFLHVQNFWRIKFTPKNANFSG